MPSPRLRLFLPTSPEAPGLCRRAVESLRGELSDDEVETLRLLMCEIVTNAVVHTAGSAPARAIATVTLTPAWIRAEVRDSGPGFRPRVGTPHLDMESGWGLQLVNALASDWGVVTCEGSWVWFELARERAVVPLPPAEAVAS
jgi:anti-sigma regulatory factor (Ser/Thr protein kinase)